MIRLARQLSTLKSSVSVTPAAWDKMSSVINKTDTTAFLLYADTGGCNGFNYRLKPVKNVEEVGDPAKISVVHKEDTKMYIDPMSEMYLIGTLIDYQQEDLDKGVFESKFTFTPDKKLATSCGCGVSFSPKLTPEFDIGEHTK